jgi:anti-anti-sigma regulatory factor
MPHDGLRAEFTIDGDTLKAHGRLRFADGQALTEALAELLDTGQTDLVLDLSEVDRLESTCIAAVVAAMMDAQDRSANLTIVAPPKIASILDSTGVGALGQIRVAE